MERKKNVTGYRPLYRRLVDRILKGDGYSSREQRLAAFNNKNLQPSLVDLNDKVAYHAYRVSDSDIASIKQTGITEDQLFELMICAAVGQASRQYESGLAALAEVLQEGSAHAS